MASQYAMPYDDVDDGGWSAYVDGSPDPAGNINMFYFVADSATPGTPNDHTTIRSNAAIANDTYSAKLTGVTSPAVGTVTIHVRARFL